MNLWQRHQRRRQLKHYHRDLASWKAKYDGFQNMLSLVRDFRGFETAAILLHEGEAAICRVASASLIQDVRGRGHYEGGSAGFSIPISSFDGRSVRFHVGATHGHYVTAPPVATAIDSGDLWVTNSRVVFQGHKQTRECDFAKLIGYAHSPSHGSTTFSVSNRQNPITISYGSALYSWFDLRLELALAIYRGATDQLTAQVEGDINSLMQSKPVPPAGMDVESTATIPKFTGISGAQGGKPIQPATPVAAPARMAGATGTPNIAPTFAHMVESASKSAQVSLKTVQTWRAWAPGKGRQDLHIAIQAVEVAAHDVLSLASSGAPDVRTPIDQARLALGAIQGTVSVATKEIEAIHIIREVAIGAGASQVIQSCSTTETGLRASIAEMEDGIHKLKRYMDTNLAGG